MPRDLNVESATHRTLCDAVLETTQSQTRCFPYTAKPIHVPAGTVGMIEYVGRVGGAHCVMFRGGGMEVNLMARGALPVCRIDWPRSREEEALASDLHLRAAA